MPQGTLERLRPYIDGAYVQSRTEKFTTVYDPSTGEAIRAGALLHAAGGRRGHRGGGRRLSGLEAHAGAQARAADVQPCAT